MGFFDGLKLGLISALGETLRGVTVTGEYQPSERENPLAARCLCVGFDEITADAGSVQYLGRQSEESGELYGKGVTVTVSFKVFVPVKEGGIACHEVFSQLAETLLLTGTGYRVQRLRCGEIRFERALGAYTLTALAEVKATALCGDDTGAAIEQVEVKRRVN